MANVDDQFLTDLAATENDPDAFAKLVFNPEDDKPGLHNGQKLYHNAHNGQVNFLLPGNSWGKTEFIVRYSLWNAWFKHGHKYPYEKYEDWIGVDDKTLIASFNYSVAEESFDRFKQYKSSNPRVDFFIEAVNLQASEVRLRNGAVIKWGSLDGSGRLVEAVRFNRIFIDEVGHIPDLSYTYDSILYPRTMGVNGIIHFFGTPKAHSDPYLLEVYEKGKNGGDGFYYSQSGAVFENSFWTEGERQRILKNPRYVTGWSECPESGCKDPVCFPHDGGSGHAILTPMGKQVILGYFIQEGGLFFNKHHIQRMFTWDDQRPTPKWTGDDRMEIAPRNGRVYAAAWDLAGNKLRSRKRNRGSDPTVGIVIDYTDRPWQIVRYDFIRGGEADWEEKYQLMEHVYHTYNLDHVGIDATGQQDSIAEALETRGLDVESIYFGGAGSKKLDMLRNLQLVTEWDYEGTKGLLRSPLIPTLKRELENYALPDDNISQDTVMTLAMVVHDIVQYELPEPGTPGDFF